MTLPIRWIVPQSWQATMRSDATPTLGDLATSSIEVSQ
jgi:hypothetical protein